MNINDREQAILKYLMEKTFASVNDLKQILHVSDATIRRDISRLHSQGALLKVFGGVAPSESAFNNRSAKRFSENKMRYVNEKTAIAKLAASLCEEGDSIIINGGSTTYMFARELENHNIRIYTNSMPVAAFLWEFSKCHFVVAGGVFHRNSGILYSQEHTGANFYASKYFLGAQAFGPEGILESNPLLKKANSELMEKSDEIIVLCDSSKFELRARFVACQIERISIVITDNKIKNKSRDMLEKQGVKVILVDPKNTDSVSSNIEISGK